MRSLQVSLRDHSTAMLKGIAELRGIELGQISRAEAAARLAAAMAESRATATALESCSPAAREAWAALWAADGRMKMAGFVRLAGNIRPVGAARLEREHLWRHAENPAEELWYRGLIFRGFASWEGGPAATIYIPDDLPAPSDYPPRGGAQQTSAVLPCRELPRHERQCWNTLAVDVCCILAALQESPLPAKSASRMLQETAGGSRDSATPAASGLVSAESTRLEMILALARGLGWLEDRGGKLAVHTPRADDWLKLTHWDQMSALFLGWRESSEPAADRVRWNDLAWVPGLVSDGGWRNDPLLARSAVLDMIATLRPDAWYELASFVAHVKDSMPDFQRPDGNYSTWYVRRADGGDHLTGFESWDWVEGRLVRFLITGPLFWLGAVVLGGDSAEDPEVFRLTRAGASWLAGAEPPDLPPPGQLTVDAQFNIAAPLLLPLRDRYRLYRVSDPDAEAYQWGRPTRHRLTRRSLARARSAGIKPDAVLTFLKKASGGSLPPQVVAALESWGRQRGSVSLRRGAVLRVEDASVLATLRSDPVLAPLLSELLSAQAALVREPDVPKVLSALTEMGYVVKSG